MVINKIEIGKGSSGGELFISRGMKSVNINTQFTGNLQREIPVCEAESVILGVVFTREEPPSQ